MDYHLQELEKKSIYILREARSKYKNLAILWTIGMDCLTCLYLCKKAFFGKVPFQIIHIDNGCDFPENYKFRDKIIKEWHIDLLVIRMTDGLNKEDVLKETAEKDKLEAIIIPVINNSQQNQARENYLRVHPLLDWTELDVWQYIKDNRIPVNPLSFSRNGKRYRSVGYPQAALPVESDASTLDGIIEELKTTQISEKQGHIKNKEEKVLERLKKLGYLK